MHIYIYIHEQSENRPPKNKVQQIDLANKGSQKLYLPVKNKTILRTNWKTKLKQGSKWEIKQ